MRRDGEEAGLPRKVGLYGPECCPRCGATPSVQKYRPRNIMDLSRVDVAGSMRPEDGVLCETCGNGFRVYHLETWDGEIMNYRDEFECVPNFCPFCGTRIRYEDEGDE